MCVDEAALEGGGGLIDMGAEGCPVPCNPTWGEDDVASICGANSLCCQTVEIQPEDCVFDSGSECWRPANGNDIFDTTVQGLNFQGADPWASTTHETHQDPGGKQCTKFSAGVPGAKDACFHALTVADQRGFCLGKGPNVQICPTAVVGYVDACEQLNITDGRCGSCSCG
jgi:hypothetical protein